MTTPNRLDLSRGYLGYREVVGHTEKNVPIAEYTGFSIRSQPERWQQWLARGESFSVLTTHQDGYAMNGYTARYEQIKGKEASFWYAYKRSAGKLRKLYMGRSEELTIDRLNEVMTRLSQSVELKGS